MPTSTPIAIVGMSCLLPGASTPEEFWAALCEETDQRSHGGPEVFGTGPDFPGGWGDSEHRITSTRGGFVQEPDVELAGPPASDTEFAGLGKVVRWPLRTARLALADAGLSEEDELGRTGLVLGNYSFPTEESVRLVLPGLRRQVSDGLRIAGLPLPATEEAEQRHADPRSLWASALPADSVSDALGLGGPHVALDAACSSALYSIALARDYLATGVADVMLAGAVCAPDPLLIHLSFSDLRALPTDDGISAPFDARSTGIVTGQGAGMVVLKRLSDALSDGDHIHAVVESIGLTNDGEGRHLLTPNMSGQLAAYRDAYTDIDPATVDYVECHATGTPLGDSTELRGLSEYFGDHGGLPLLGSVKGNVGHLLTVAGFTSLLKVVLAMRHGRIPATPGIAAPLSPEGAQDAAERIVVRDRAWPDGNRRRAAVSAFGFGGTNAHLVLAAAPESETTPHDDALPQVPRVAVTGVGAKLGALDDAAAVHRAARVGASALRERPPHRWYGAEDTSGPLAALGESGYVDELRVDVSTYRIPPMELNQANPQHLLMFEAADAALADAGFAPSPSGTRGEQLPPRRVAVVFATELEPHTHTHRARFDIGAHVRAECDRAGVTLPPTELDRLEAVVRDAVHEPIGANEVLSYIGNIMASRISASRNLTGPSFTISADRTAGARAMEIAALLLLDPTIEAVLVGGVDLACGMANTHARTRVAEDHGPQVPPLGDGAAAVVLTRPDDADRAYATVDSVALRTNPAAAARAGLDSASTDASKVDYLELGAADPAKFSDELAALSDVYRGDDRSCAVGALAPLVGDTQQCSVVASLVKVVLCLYQAELPATPEVLRLGGSADDTAFYRTDGPRPWLRRERGGTRVAALSAVGSATAAHLVVSARRTVAADRAVDWTGGPGMLLLPLTADDAAGLADRARESAAELESGRDALTVCREHAHNAAPGRLSAVLVAADTDRLRAELRAAERDLPTALGSAGEWFTPAGSYCTARPLGPDGRVAFVYPGAFTSYPGVGRELFRLFPGLMAEFEDEFAQPVERFRHRELYPRTREPLDRRSLLRHEAELLDNVPVMLTAGTNIAVLHSRLLRGVLGVRPHGGFGYSLGESSMLFATGVWEPSSRDDFALTESPLFRNELCGVKDLVRSCWNLPPDTPDSEVWATHVLLAEPAEVRVAAEGLERVFLTHVNTPHEVVVAGNPQQCRELIGRLGCQSAKAPANHVMHVPMVDQRLSALATLNDYPLGEPDPDLELLSAYDYDRVRPWEQADVAERIARTLRSTIDFARLTTTAYERGFRYFIEVGPGATCTRWIGDTLKGLDHVAVTMDRHGASAGTTLARLLAQLASHNLPVKLATLLGEPEETAETSRTGGRRLSHVVTCGGESIVARVRDAATPVLESAAVDHPAPTPTTATDSLEDFLLEETATAEEAIVIEGEPFVYLPSREPRAAAETAELVLEDAEAPPLPHAATCVAHPQKTVRSQPEAGQPGPLAAIATSVARAHRSALRAQNALQEKALHDLMAAAPTQPGTMHQTAIWDSDDLLEFAGGSVAAVFGPDFAEIDTYPVRVRLPEPPYLFVSRVTELTGITGSYEPSSITTEYDVPIGAWYTVDGLVPCAVTIEAGQCDLLLISYLGIDFRNRGERVYRLLDSRLVFHGDLPREGQTLRYEISIDRFVWNGDNLLFFFNYRCYADGVLILELLDATAGFFSHAELDDSLGVVETGADRKRRAAMTPTWFKPLARTDRTELSGRDLELLTVGRPGEVFGPHWDQSADGCNRSLRLPGEMLRMIDEIPRIDRLGGPRGLGELTAVKQLDPNGWYFRCHFTGDPVLAGSLVAEGGVQILQVYAMYLGLHLVLPDAQFQSVRGLRTEVKVRGQITPETPRITYHVEIIGVSMLPRPTVTADITVYDGEKPVVAMRDFGIQVRERPGTPHRPEAGGVPQFLGRRNEAGEAAFINELHLAHAAKGDLGTAMGPEFDIYRQSRAPYIPNGDFRFVDRIMQLDGTRGQPRPGATMVTEYDSPPEAWYYIDNAFPGMPNCVHMETSLQAAILLGYYLGATLDSPDEEFSIRNLDGHAELVREVDLRGKTIRHESTLLSSSAGPGATLQRFRYQLSADGEVFYNGESLFGYFTESALANQVGLDAGSCVAPWLDRRTDLAPERVRTIPVRTDDGWVASRNGLRLADGHLRLVDEVDVVADGGDHGRGYLRGRRRIDPADWYFDCHFHRDPVMPGSLGVEAVIQALQLYVLENGLAADLGPATFAVPLEVRMGWKYRGQILRSDEEMSFDAHITEIRREPGCVTVIADANVWKPGLRIYELTNVAVQARHVDR